MNVRVHVFVWTHAPSSSECTSRSGIARSYANSVKDQSLKLIAKLSATAAAPFYIATGQPMRSPISPQPPQARRRPSFFYYYDHPSECEVIPETFTSCFCL